MGLVHHPNVVTDGLVACWDAGNRRSYPGAGDSWAALGAGSGGTLNPSSGPTFVSDKMGYITFDGTDDYAEFQLDTMTLSEGSSGSAYDESTIVLWVQWGPGDTNGCILAANHPSGGDTTDNGFRYPSWGFFNSSGGNVKFTSGVGQTGSTDWGLVEDEWAQITIRCRFASSGTPYYTTYMKVWINGIEVYEGSGPAGYFLNEGAFRIASGDGACWEGSLASIHVYNRELTDAEVKQNYEATKPRFTPRITKSGMFANWDAGDPNSYNGGTTWKDTANHYDGTLENDDDGSLTFDSANGGSLVFDGTDDYVGPIAIGDHSSTARSVIIWAAADSYAAGPPDGCLFNSASDKFSASFGMSNYYGAFYFKSKSTHTSPYQYGISASSLVAGSWHCWAVTINASDEIVAMYQDGESKSLGNNNGFHLKDDTYIGCRMQGSALQSPWKGKIGTVRLYTKTLSHAEVMDNFQKTRGRFGV